MENWEKEVRKDAREWAKRFSKVGIASKEMDDFLKELSIRWGNESQEWREEFIRGSKVYMIVFLIDNWTMN